MCSENCTGRQRARDPAHDPGQARVHHPRPARPDGIARLRAEPLSEEVLGDLKLALTEACTNSVRHAYGDGAGLVEIVYELY